MEEIFSREKIEIKKEKLKESFETLLKEFEQIKNEIVEKVAFRIYKERVGSSELSNLLKQKCEEDFKNRKSEEPQNSEEFQKYWDWINAKELIKNIETPLDLKIVEQKYRNLKGKSKLSPEEQLKLFALEEMLNALKDKERKIEEWKSLEKDLVQNLHQNRKNYLESYNKAQNELLKKIKILPGLRKEKKFNEILRKNERLILEIQNLIQKEGVEKITSSIIKEKLSFFAKDLDEKQIKVLWDLEMAKYQYDQSKLELARFMKEIKGASSFEIMKTILFDEKERLIYEKTALLPSREKNWMRNLLERWSSLNPWERRIYTTLLATGGFMAVNALAGIILPLPVVAGYAVNRLARSAIGAMVGQFFSGMIEKKWGKKLEKRKEEIMKELKERFEEELDEAGLRTAISQLEKNYDIKFKEWNASAKRKMILKALALVTTGGATSLLLSPVDFEGIVKNMAKGLIKPAEAAPIDSSKLMPPEEMTTKEMPPIGPATKKQIFTLPIGKRGPEGAIIDFFKKNPEIAKNFGWDPEKYPSLEEWAGKKAHLLWLEEAKEALKKPETLETLKKLGYSPDLKGYEEMMTRIGKGYVEIDPNTGKIELKEMKYLKKIIPKPGIEEITKPQVMEEAPTGPQVFEEVPRGPQIFEEGPTETPGIEEIPQEPQVFEEESYLSPKNFDSNLYNFATTLDEKWNFVKNFKFKSITGTMAKEILNKLGDPQIYIEDKTEIFVRDDDVIVIKNGYKEGFNLLVNFNKESLAKGIISGKIGVEGPEGWNKFVKGSFLGIGRAKPEAPLTFDNFQEAKKFILEYEREEWKDVQVI